MELRFALVGCVTLASTGPYCMFWCAKAAFARFTLQLYAGSSQI